MKSNHVAFLENLNFSVHKKETFQIYFVCSSAKATWHCLFMRFDLGHSRHPTSAMSRLSGPPSLQAWHHRHEAESWKHAPALCESSADSRHICVVLTKHLKSWNKNVNSQIRCYGVIYFFLISADECPWGTRRCGGGLNFLMSSIMCCHYVIIQAPLSRREQACHAFTQAARLEGFP